jgi:hypothetical protein
MIGLILKTLRILSIGEQTTKIFTIFTVRHCYVYKRTFFVSSISKVIAQHNELRKY